MDLIDSVLLGVIAAACVVQTVVLVALLVGASRVTHRLGEHASELERELRPQLARLGELADGIAHVSDRARRQFAGVESTIGEATDRVRRTGEAVERAVQRPAGLIAAAVVFTLARRLFARRAARV